MQDHEGHVWFTVVQGGGSTYLIILRRSPPSELKKATKTYKEMCVLGQIGQKIFACGAKKSRLATLAGLIQARISKKNARFSEEKTEKIPARCARRP